MPPSSLILFRPFFLGIRNRFFRDNQISLRTAAVLSLGAGLFIALYLVSLRMIGYFHSQSELGNHFVGMGRSKTPTITREDGSIYYDADYVFTPGKADWLRRPSSPMAR